MKLLALTAVLARGCGRFMNRYPPVTFETYPAAPPP
jgi:hypothetical protein